MDYDIVIIGAGAVGLACAAMLSEKYSVLVIERHESFGQETSSRNSEVIHAGIYYPTGSLKANLCVPGNKSIYDWCARYNVPHNRIGKYIIAVTQDEEEKLEKLYQQAIANGVDGIHHVSMSDFKIIEPNVKATTALWSPSTGIMDTHSLMQSYEFVALNNGCDFAWKHELKGISKIDGGYSLSIIDPDGGEALIQSPIVINAAGLDCDTVAEMAGIDIYKEHYDIQFCRGHYFRIAPGKKNLVNHLIYPVPPNDALSLGIHVTIELNGQLKLGPDTQYLTQRVQDYNVAPTLQDKFYKAASRYLNMLEYNDITPDQSGIRPKLQKAGEPFRDFIIKEESDKGLPGLINLIGIESPGLTCSLEIGKYVLGLL